MARRKQAPKDLTGIRQRGGRYQIRLFGGQDPVTGKQVMLTGSAEDEDAAIKLRDKFRRQVAEATAARTSVTLGYLLDEWLAGHQVEGTTRTSYRIAIDKFLKPAVGDTSLSRLAQLGSRPFEQLYAELRICRRRCKGRTFIEHYTQREHKCDKRCAPHTCKPLSMSSYSRGLVGVLGSIVEVLRPAMLRRRRHGAVGDLVAAQLVGDDHPRRVPQALEQLAEELLRRDCVAAALHQDIEYDPVLIDGSPEVVSNTVDLDEYLVHVPLVARVRPLAPQGVGVVMSELLGPLSDCFVRDHYATGEHQLGDISQGQGEPEVEPDHVANDLARIPEPRI